MKIKFAIAGVLFVGLTGSAVAVGAKESFYISHDIDSKKCAVTKENSATGADGTGEKFESEAAAKAAMDKMPECAAK